MATTLKDVAARAGVSIKTVSNVVNEHPYITEDTRQRVLTAITALGYRPNLSARHLRHARVGVLALAIPDLSNSYFATLGSAVISAAARRSYTVLLDQTNGDRDHEMRVASGLRPHLIDGVILSPLSTKTEDLRRDAMALPLVLLGEHLIAAPHDHVGIDNVAAAALATTHLVEMGRRHIAAIGVQSGDGAYNTARLRLQGYNAALAAAGYACDTTLLGQATMFHRQDGAEAMRRLLEGAQPPDAVFCFNDLLALGALRALHEGGYRVPDDVAVVGFDNIEEGAYATPSLTTIAPDIEAIAQTAVALLIERITERNARAAPPRYPIVPFQLLARESTTGRHPL